MPDLAVAGGQQGALLGDSLRQSGCVSPIVIQPTLADSDATAASAPS